MLPRAAPTEEQWVIIQKILSCVGHMQGERHGTERVIRVLRGEAGGAPGEEGLDKLTTFGLLAGESPGHLAALLGALQDECCLYPAQGPDAPLALTPYGLKVVMRRVGFELAWPGADGVPARRTPLHRAPPSASSRATPRRRPVAAEPSGASRTIDAGLLERLKYWRSREAARAHIPAYRIFPNRTLEAIASCRPQNDASLLDVPGIGPSKFSSYSQALLKIVNQGESE